MKKLLIFVCLIITATLSISCNTQNKLLILNWGEYINDDVVKKFEEEYNCVVMLNLADSNELFYSKIKSGTTAYDLVVPSDYMIEKMYNKGLLQELNFDLLPNYDINDFLPGVLGIQSQMFKGNEKYNVPYFWGTFGLMYNKECVGLEKALLDPKTGGWTAYFNEQYLPKNTRVGMYDVPRFAYAATMFYNNMNPNVVSDEALSNAFKTLTQMKFDSWQTDELKKSIESKNLDLAFVYTGDCLDMLYDKLGKGTNMNNISFDILIPDNTIAFMDSLVIPKNARHVELAHKFINFMLETENARDNASVIGYCTPLISSYKEITNYQGSDMSAINRAYAVKKYYPLPNEGEISFKGTVLTDLNRDYLTKITNMFNDAKTK